MNISTSCDADRLPLPRTQRGTNRVLILLGLSVLINYVDRSNLSIAAPLIKDELGISASQLGTLLSAFFWTYALLQIPAGWLVDRFDVKWVFALGFFVWSAATAVTGVLHGFVALLLIRVVLGVGECVAFPAVGKILCTQFSESNRGFANSVVMAGLALGPAVGMMVGGNLVALFGWRPFFVGLGLLGFLWLAPWWAWMPQRQASHASPTTHQSGVLDILRQRSAWGTCVCQFSFNYTSYFLVTWLPFYLIRERQLAMTQMAKVGGFVFILNAISALTFGKVADRWIAAGASPSRARKTFAVLGGTGMGVFLIAAAFAPAPAYLWMLALMGIFTGMATSNIWAITQTIAGAQMVGRWTGVQNFAGNLAGIVAPALAGLLLDRTGHFYWPFVIAAVILWIGALNWIFVVGPVREIDWGSQTRNAPAILATGVPKSL
jgi:ACS family D-galactonate transporter-like MFS transporter